MTTSRLSNFLQNIDFTAQKQKNKIYFELNIPAGDYANGDTWYVDKECPSGIFFENVTIKVDSEQNYLSTNYAMVLTSNGDGIFISVHRLNNNRYRLLASFQRISENSTQMSAMNIKAWLNLSISPF